MQNFKFAFVCLFLLAVCLITSPNVCAQDEIMTNEEIISLTKAGLSKTVIINKIRGSKTNFDLSTNSLIKLKQANIDDEIVGVMLEAKNGRTAATTVAAASAMAAGDPNDPAAPHDYGIYMFEERDGGKKMTRLTPNVSAQNRTGGLFTSSITYGIGKVKTKANLPGTSAAIQIQNSRPVFYFYLDTKSGGFNTVTGIPSTPNEFTLVKFNVRSDNREITIGKANAFGAKGGLSDESVVGFDAQEISAGIFKITPRVELKNGEYGFYLINSGNSNANAAVGSKFFDFGVKLTP